MDHGEVERMFELWQGAVARQHEDFMAAVHAFEKLYEQMNGQCIASNESVLDRLDAKAAAATWWRSIASGLIGLSVGLLGAGVPIINHINDIDTNQARIAARQEMVLSELMNLKVADARTAEAVERLKEQVYQQGQAPVKK